MTSLPRPIARELGSGFVDYTVTRRFPKIVRDASAAVEDAAKQRAMAALLDQVIAGTALETNVLRRATPFWSEYIAGLEGATWLELPFFDLEVVFYHALNSIAGFFEDGTDVFRPTRDRALADAIAQLSPPHGAELDPLILGALFANEADFSLLSFGGGSPATWSERLLVNERAALAGALANAAKEGASVHVIADNVGPELLADLVLIERVLSLSNEIEVVLHCKPWPMFVSDALVGDVERARSALRARGQGEALERLQIEADAAWGEPRHFDNLPQPLVSRLQAASVVIAKGDFNYRRFVGDRAWPAETPVSDATAGIPFTSYALRVLKSDAVAGVPAAVAARVEAERADWRTAGVYALIQKLEGRRSP